MIHPPDPFPPVRRHFYQARRVFYQARRVFYQARRVFYQARRVFYQARRSSTRPGGLLPGPEVFYQARRVSSHGHGGYRTAGDLPGAQKNNNFKPSYCVSDTVPVEEGTRLFVSDGKPDFETFVQMRDVHRPIVYDYGEAGVTDPDAGIQRIPRREAPSAMTTVFICHASEDLRLAEAMVKVFKGSLRDTDVICTSVRGHTIRPGDDWMKQVREVIASCEVFVVLLTYNSLSSNQVLLELGARWGHGEPIIPVVVPGIAPNQIPLQLRLPHRIEINDVRSVHELLQTVCGLIGQDFHMASESAVDDLATSAKGYQNPKPIPERFEHVTQDPRRLSPDMICQGAEKYLRGEFAQRDNFRPDLVVGINTGGLISASVFSEHQARPLVGLVQTQYKNQKRSVAPERTLLPMLSDTEKNILLADSKLGTGDSIVLLAQFLRDYYRRNDLDIRLLVTLVYDGWEKREHLRVVDPWWPVMLEIPGLDIPMPLYAMYYTKKQKKLDDIKEPGRWPRGKP